MVAPITGPTNSYQPQNQSISTIDQDLQTAQSNYTNAVTALNTAYTPYIDAKNAIPPLVATHDAAVQLVQTDQAILAQKQADYNNYNNNTVIPSYNYYIQQLTILNNMSANDPNRPAQQQVVDNAYSAWQSNFNTLIYFYQAAVNTAQANLNAAIIAEQIANTNMENGFTNFSQKSTAYYTAYTTAQTTASHLIDIEGYKLQFLDNATGSDIEDLYTTLVNSQNADGNAIDPNLISAFNSAKLTLTASRNDMRFRLSQLMQNEPNVTTQRLSYIQRGDEAFVAYYRKDYTTYNQKLADQANIQTAINSLITQRDTLRNQLATSTTSFDNAYTTIQNQMVGIGTTLPDIALAWNTFLAQKIAEADTFFNTTLDQLTNSDSSSLGAYQAANPSYSPALEANVLTAQTNANAVMTTIQASGLNTVASVDISLPQIPPAGQLSMSDLMRFIAKIQTYIQTLLSSLQVTDSHIREYRLKLLTAQQQSITDESALRFEYVVSLHEQDVAYNQEVANDNLNRYYSTINAINNFNTQFSAISDKVSDKNSEINSFNSAATDITNQINNITSEIASTTGYAPGVTSDSINVLDITNQDANYSSLGSQVAAAPVLPQPPMEDLINFNLTIVEQAVPPYDLTSGHVPTLSQYNDMVANDTPATVYDTSTITFPSQQDINTLNATIFQINRTLNPIIDQLGPPINFTLIPPLVYRSYTPVRDVGTLFNFLDVFQALTQFVYAIVNLIFKNTYTDKQDKTAFIKGLVQVFSGLTAPHVGDISTESPGSGVGLQTTNLNVNPSRMHEILNQLFTKQTFEDFINGVVQLASLTAGINTIPQLSTKKKNYSLFGVVQGDAKQHTEAAVRDTEQKASYNVAKNLFQTASNGTLLTKQALELLAKLQGTEQATLAEIQQLLKLLTFLQQLVLLLLGAVAAAASGGKEITGATIGQGIQQLFRTAQPNIGIFSDNTQATQFSNQLTSLGISTQASDALTSLLSGSPQTASLVSTLNKNGFQLSGTENNLTLTEQVLNQTQDLILQQSKAAQQEQEQITQQVSNQDLLRRIVTDAIRNYGLTQDSIDAFEQKLRSGEKIGTAFREIVDTLPHTIIQNLHVDLTKYSKEQIEKITAQSKDLAQSLSILSEEDRVRFLIAITTGAISPEAASNLVAALLQVQQRGFSLDSAAILAHTQPGAPIGYNKPPSHIPPDLATALKEALDALSPDDKSQRFIVAIAEQFGKTLEDSLRFYKFSLDFLLDPAMSIIKNFSLATQQTQGPYHQLPTSIPI